MDKLSKHKQDALKSIQKADYLMGTTYPMLKEPKTLLIISDIILSSFLSSASVLLSLERSKKTIPPYHDTTESKMSALKEYIVRKYKINEYFELMQRMLTVEQEQKQAPIQFSRDKKYVLLSQNNKVTAVTESDVKLYIKKAKELYTLVDQLTANE